MNNVTPTELNFDAKVNAFEAEEKLMSTENNTTDTPDEIEERIYSSGQSKECGEWLKHHPKAATISLKEKNRFREGWNAHAAFAHNHRPPGRKTMDEKRMEAAATKIMLPLTITTEQDYGGDVRTMSGGWENGFWHDVFVITDAGGEEVARGKNRELLEALIAPYQSAPQTKDGGGE